MTSHTFDVDSISLAKIDMPESQERDFELMLKSLIEMFKQFQITWWPEKSTLLASIRDGKTHLSYNDHLDIGVLEDEFNKKIRQPKFLDETLKGIYHLEYDWFGADEILRISVPNPWMFEIDKNGNKFVWSCHIDIYAFKEVVSEDKETAKLVLANERLRKANPNQYHEYFYFYDEDTNEPLKRVNTYTRKLSDIFNSNELFCYWDKPYEYLQRMYGDTWINKIVYFRDPNAREEPRTKYRVDFGEIDNQVVRDYKEFKQN